MVQKKKSSVSSAHVLDLGTGSGLLAVMAAKAGANSVVACDIHESLCATARQVQCSNGMLLSDCKVMTPSSMRMLSVSLIMSGCTATE